MKTLIASVLLLTSPAFGAYRAGVARVKITPDKPIWLSGYATRTHASDGVLHEIWAKALAIQEGKSKPIVIVTADLVGFPRVLTDEVARQVQEKFGIERSRLLFNTCHTHTGPVVWPNLSTAYDLPPGEEENLRRYARKLEADLVALIGRAVADLAPADLSYGHGKADFAVNRREPTGKGFKIGVNRNGQGDHEVPVLRVTRANGKIVAVLFGYACHNTTLTEKFYQISGDYAGFAQSELEQAHPGANAMFLMLCGADQNPNPRSQVELARRYGKELADSVQAVLSGPMQPVRGAVRSSYLVTKLAFAPQSRETFEKESHSPVTSRARRAQAILRAMDEHHPVVDTPYPVQAFRFGKSLTLLALGGESVVGYDLRAKQEFPGEPLIVAGYSNDVMCYIPTRKILAEGGYEPVDSMVYYGQPGPLAEDVEERVFGAIRETMRAVGR